MTFKKVAISILVVIGVLVIGYFGYYMYQSRQTCIAVLAPARNIMTGQCKSFPSPCHVPPIFYKEDKSCDPPF